MSRAVRGVALLAAGVLVSATTGFTRERRMERNPIRALELPTVGRLSVGVSVTPSNGTDPTPRVENSTGNQVTFTVTNTGTVDTRYSRTCSALGKVVLVDCTFISGVLTPGESRTVTATFTAGTAGSGTVQLTVTCSQPTGCAGTGKWNETVVSTARVTPDGGVVRVSPNTSGLYRDFQVTNTGTGSTTYAMTPVCSGVGVVNNSCIASPTSLPLGGGASGTVRVTYTSGAEKATGLVELDAKVGSVLFDAGTLNVTVAPAPPPPPPPGVDVASTNPGAVLPRGECLAIALASAAASECGDLRIVHPLPAVRTMNRWRTPTLEYNSAHATGWVSVAANVTLSASEPVPTTVTAELKINGGIRASGSWAGNQWTMGSTRRIALGFSGPTTGLSTGIYDYEFNVTKISGTSQTVSTTGKLVIVDRSTSVFGAGWWLAGIEQWYPATAVWIGGDGSARLYTLRPGSAPPNRVWGAPSVSYPDSIRESGTEFVRQLPDSVWVFFDAQGRHVRTRNRQGHVTTFTYDVSTGNLLTITLPPAGAPLTYTFNYVNGKVSTIVAPGVPANRTTTLTINATNGRLTSILEPDGRSVGFGYGSDNKITSRTDRRLTVTNFQYDAGSHVSQATINLQPGTITRTVQQATSKGFAGVAPALSGVFTRLDGPRSVNTTSFFVNRFSAPDTIIDALGQHTWLIRGDARFLGLITQASGVTGHTVNATYDARGRILTSDQPSASGQIATTSYTWDAKWDHVTRITNPEGDFMDFGIEASTGNRLWQQDGRGSTSRTNFTYYPADNQLNTLTAPNTPAENYVYDGHGNLQTHTTPLGMQATWTNNAIGLTIRTQTPTGTSPNWTPYQIDTMVYSLRNEELTHITSVAPESTTVSRTYDEEGNLLTVTRSFVPNTNPGGPIGPLTTTWLYDRANRQTRQTEPDGSVERRGFDEAGDLVSDTTRRGLVIPMTYDALNRLSTRTVPAGSASLTEGPHIFPATPVNQLPYTYSWTADNQTFQYTADGQVSLATNRDATVTRAFHASGRVVAETLGIKSTDRSTTHSYATTFTYDKDGRRTTVAAPSQFTGTPVRYEYAPFWGALNRVTDIAGNSFSFAYTNRGEVQRIDYSGGIYDYLTYDNDGRPSTDVITNGPNQAFPYYPGTQLRNFSVSVRNARGQILTSTDAAQADQVKATYSGLGYLLTSNLHQNLVVGATQSASYASGDAQSTDGLGNLLTTTTRDSIDLGSGYQVTTKNGSNVYSTVGRLSTRVLGTASTAYSYDASGNAYFEASTVVPNVTNERAAYYGPNETLLATDTRASGQRTFEEYRYDGLGRRVWVKSIMTCEPSSQSVQCNTPYVRRTIWDGGQELAEIQVPVDGSNSEELDAGYPIVPWNFSPADPNPFYGRVVYGPGLAVDRPLSVTRYEYRDQPSSGGSTLTWPRFTWQIYWNYQGVPAYGTLTSGAWANPYQLGQGQSSCPLVGDQTTQRCVLVQWPLMHSAYDQNRGRIIYLSWHGSVLEGKRNRSGLEYRRNRQYDPQTGRFTQEDPIGLGGGLNLYGFASGDQVNFSDPFGLRACSAIRRDITRSVDNMQRRNKQYIDAFRRGQADAGHVEAIDNARANYSALMEEYKDEGCYDDDDHENFKGTLRRGELLQHQRLPFPQSGDYTPRKVRFHYQGFCMTEDCAPFTWGIGYGLAPGMLPSGIGVPTVPVVRFWIPVVVY